MGGSRRGSSSKTKSSKRKRDKISSKKKSRREEPKKRRRVLDSVTSDSDNDSLNSKHSSSSTSESDHRRRINKNKKRRPSLSSYSDYESVSSDSDSDNANKSKRARRSKVGLKDTKRRSGKRYTRPTVPKRKRLDRDRVRKKLKKSSKKKSRKYSSSDSESCSTSQSRSSSSTADCKSDEILHKDIDKPKGKESHRGKKKRKVSPSFDGGSQPSVNVSSGDGRPFPRRLKSVITVVDLPNNDVENRWEMDVHKEEIVYDQNDYPSPKSVDSHECGGRMESSKDSHGVFNERVCVENVADVEVGKPIIDSEKEKETDVSVPEAASSGGDLLESILRQRALENLRKFKGRIQTGLSDKMNDEIDMDGQNKLTDLGKTDERSGLPSREEICLNKVPDNEGVGPPNGTAVLECSEEDTPVSRSESVPVISGANDCTVESSSAVGPGSGELSVEQGTEAKDGSQFEEKTMSVMRGGELVQVSYKVYIPKKAPGMARRQLRR